MLAVANYYNDSITMFTGGLGIWNMVTPDIDLRPGGGTFTTLGTAGGEYPFWVVIQGSGQNAAAFAMNNTQTRLYVAEDMSDTLDVIDISKGSTTNGAAAILPDGRRQTVSGHADWPGPTTHRKKMLASYGRSQQ
jgi:hypothetical protein